MQRTRQVFYRARAPRLRGLPCVLPCPTHFFPHGGAALGGSEHGPLLVRLDEFARADLELVLDARRAAALPPPFI